MGLDKDDTIVKRRMAQKMQFLAEDVAAAHEPTTGELKSWFEKNEDRFTLPGRVSFRHLYFSTDRRGERARDGRRDRARQARRAAGGREGGDSLRRSVHVPGLLRRPRARAAGQGVRPGLRTGGLQARRPGAWQGPVESGYGWHLVFVDSAIPGRLPAFEEVESDVKTAWLGVQKAAAWQKAYDAMRAKYTVRLPGPPETKGEPPADRDVPGGSSAGQGTTVTPARRCSGWLLAGPLLCALLVGPDAWSHEARPAYLELKETAPGRFDLLWRTPVLAGRRLPVALRVPADVRNVKEPSVQELADSLLERRWIDAGPGGLAGKRIEFPGLQVTITDVLVRVELLDGRTVDDARPPVAALGGDRRDARTGGERSHLRPDGHRAHPARSRPPALRARAAAHRLRPLDAAEDHHRVHRGPQHHPGHRHARLRPGSARSRSTPPSRSPSSSSGRRSSASGGERRASPSATPGWWPSPSVSSTASASPAG